MERPKGMPAPYPFNPCLISLIKLLTFVVKVVDEVENEVSGTLAVLLSSVRVNLGRELRDNQQFTKRMIVLTTE
jgi:hypothetical protein